MYTKNAFRHFFGLQVVSYLCGAREVLYEFILRVIDS